MKRLIACLCPFLALLACSVASGQGMTPSANAVIFTQRNATNTANKPPIYLADPAANRLLYWNNTTKFFAPATETAPITLSSGSLSFALDALIEDNNPGAADYFYFRNILGQSRKAKMSDIFGIPFFSWFITRSEIGSIDTALDKMLVFDASVNGFRLAPPVVSTENGWTPVLAIVSDGARRVLRVVDWTGGDSDKPATGKYVGAAGFVDAIGDGVDIRGSTGAAGADGIAWQGAWVSGVYAVDDVVEHNGSAWVATAAITNEEPGVDPEWELVAAQGDTGPPGTAGAGVTWLGAWNIATAYVQFDAVESGGSSYIANTNTTGAEPPAAAWDLWVAKGDQGDPSASEVAQALVATAVDHVFVSGGLDRSRVETVVTIAPASGNMVTPGSFTVADAVYDATGWDASALVPTRNAVRDVIVSHDGRIAALEGATPPEGVTLADHDTTVTTTAVRADDPRLGGVPTPANSTVATLTADAALTGTHTSFQFLDPSGGDGDHTVTVSGGDGTAIYHTGASGILRVTNGTDFVVLKAEGQYATVVKYVVDVTTTFIVSGPPPKNFAITFDPAAVCAGAVDRLFLRKVGADTPGGMIITRWSISFEADPTTEVDLDLKRASAMIGVGSAAVMDVLDTTSGVATETTAANINAGAVIANAQVLYLEFGTAYTEAGHQIMFEFDYY